MAAPDSFAEPSVSSCTAGAVHTWPEARSRPSAASYSLADMLRAGQSGYRSGRARVRSLRTPAIIRARLNNRGCRGRPLPGERERLFVCSATAALRAGSLPSSLSHGRQALVRRWQVSPPPGVAIDFSQLFALLGAAMLRTGSRLAGANNQATPTSPFEGEGGRAYDAGAS